MRIFLHHEYGSNDTHTPKEYIICLFNPPIYTFSYSDMQPKNVSSVFTIYLAIALSPLNLRKRFDGG